MLRFRLDECMNSIAEFFPYIFYLNSDIYSKGESQIPRKCAANRKQQNRQNSPFTADRAEWKNLLFILLLTSEHKKKVSSAHKMKEHVTENIAVHKNTTKKPKKRTQKYSNFFMIR